jgi:hypothetical protein
MGGYMSQMPPLPVQLNTELANKFLPPKGMPAFSPIGMPALPFPPVAVGMGAASAMMHPTMMPNMGLPLPNPTGMIGYQQQNGATPSMMIPPPIAMAQAGPQGAQLSISTQGMIMVPATADQNAVQK